MFAEMGFDNRQHDVVKIAAGYPADQKEFRKKEESRFLPGKLRDITRVMYPCFSIVN
jgi:hypothetical protein